MSAAASDSEPREIVLAEYFRLLTLTGNPLVDDAQARPQLAAQLYSVVDAVLGAPPAATRPADTLSEVIGRTRATAGLNPSDSLKAAGLIFQAALPTVAEHHPEGTAAAALALNRVIMQRMAVAAFGYGHRLLTQVHDSRQEERRRISRRLHDVAAPTVAVALQNLELHGIYAQSAPDRADAKLLAAREAMETVGVLVRELSAELRHHVDDGGLAAAVQATLDAVPSAVRTALHTTGPVDSLSAAFAEETFLIVREAVRNAVAHAAPSCVTVELVAADGLLTATVVDDGAGFDVDAVRAGDRHVGMDSMTERAHLLSATLDLTSAPGDGTRMVLRVPSGPGR